MLQSNFAERSAREVASTFGVEFAETLPSLRVKEWSQPVNSAYGAHLVYLNAVNESYIPEYAAIAKRVATDYATDVRQKANNQFKTMLLEKYNVTRPSA